ncbi:MAG: BtrH N-terminal domain-containing protein [Spirochaetaceae bacterium]|jgi:hypothetical protein|nr:BtrH N-terminal domain-containing protein [Spirochaetaceae bacterium]
MKKVLELKPSGGDHCITNSLKQVLRYYGWNITEAMLLGLGEGLGFVYLNAADAPLLSCRSKPFVFEKNLERIPGLNIGIKRPVSNETAFEEALKQIDDGRPFMVYLDMVYLPYMNLGESSHFGGHGVVIFGYDREKQLFYVSDRDNRDHPVHTPKGCIAEDFHLVDFSAISQARNSAFRPFPPGNRWADIRIEGALRITADAIRGAVCNNMHTMAEPPARLLGVSGIRKFSAESKKWKTFSDEKLQRSAISNYFMIHKDGGTGGGAFRKLYGDFLAEAAEMVPELKEPGAEFRSIAEDWEEIASCFMEIHNTCRRDRCDEISVLAARIAEREEAVARRILSQIG